MVNLSKHHPYILITGGGGLGATVARIDQGQVVGIDITDPGQGYTNPPNIIFTKLVNLKEQLVIDNQIIQHQII